MRFIFMIHSAYAGPPSPELMQAVGKLAEHFDRLGTKLRGSIEAYNDALGSLEGNVLVKARKFKDLQAANGNGDIAPLPPIDRVPRMLQAPELTGGLPFHDAEEEEEGETQTAGRI